MRKSVLLRISYFAAQFKVTNSSFGQWSQYWLDSTNDEYDVRHRQLRYSGLKIRSQAVHSRSIFVPGAEGCYRAIRIMTPGNEHTLLASGTRELGGGLLGDIPSAILFIK